MGIDVCPCAPYESCRHSCGWSEPILEGTAGYATFPVPSPVQRQFSLSEDVATDTLTGLSWQRRADPARRTLAQARAHCDQLSQAGLRWRLPGRIEMVTLLDASRTPAIDDGVFPDTPDDYFWSTSHPGGDPSSAYGFYFGQGETVVARAENASAHARCVSGSRQPSREWIESERGLTDPGTGLVWRALPARMPVESAARECSERAGRLPTIYELQSLVDEGQRRFRLPSVSGDDVGAVWSVTTRDFGEVVFWVVRPDGTSELRERNEELTAFCVLGR